MAALIPIGAIVTLLGLAGLIWCIVKVSRARKAGLRDDDLRAVLQSTVALNLGAVALSGVGLMMVVAGVILS